MKTLNDYSVYGIIYDKLVYSLPTFYTIDFQLLHVPIIAQSIESCLSLKNNI